jgi:3-mercaptopyruvate sulfurtransferase SseA
MTTRTRFHHGLRHGLSFGLSWLLMLAPAAATGTQSGRLVDAAWLQQRLGEVLLIDASTTRDHLAGHVPGAVNADRYRHGAQDPTPPQMQERLQSWGVSPGRKVVIYDQGADFMAPRLFYDLYYHGVPVKDLLVLDGGLAAWRAHGGAVVSDATPPPARGTFRVTALRDEARVRLPQFLVASGDPDHHVLIDALGSDHYYGARRLFDRAGHVPHAVSMPSSDLFNADKTFKSAAELQRLLRYAGIGHEHTVHSHCGGGGAAAVNWFALRFIAGHPKVTLYQESQREWLRDSRGLPFWTYAAPQHLRSAAWVDGWNSPMLRLFGAADLSIVDVRGADAYGLGHLPFAVNIPAPVLRAQIGDAQRLAATLGEVGVGPEHDVVIVGDGGLSPAAALAFLAFEQMGHARVSLLMDSVDDWALGGRELTQVATAVRPPQGMSDLAVPPTAYPVRSKGTAWVSDPSRTPGVYAKVYVAAGASPPQVLPPGPVVHLPTTGLIGADGQPKPAAELWRLIDQAGVPRHAELIVFADDPAEAAITYVVFRLMGWPDVKVWAR